MEQDETGIGRQTAPIAVEFNGFAPNRGQEQRGRHMKQGLSAFVLVLATLTSVSTPAQAATPGRCVSRGEYRQVHRGMTKHHVHRIFDTRGRRTAFSRHGGVTAEIRRYRGRLYALAPLPALVRTNREASRIDLGAGLGHFSLVAASDGGIRIPSGVEATLGFRMGGESLRPHPGRPRKRLKDLCQEAGVVPWMRDRLPLVYVGGRLARYLLRLADESLPVASRRARARRRP